MSPFQTLFEVLRLHLIHGDQVQAKLSCPSCMDKPQCDCGYEPVTMSSLFSDTPEWQHEAALIVEQQPLIGMRDPIMRKVVAPILEANRIMADEEGTKRVFDHARESLARCTAVDWRDICLKWVDHTEKTCGR